MSYKEFDLELDPQYDNTPESEVDEDAIYINLYLNKHKRKARIGS